MKKTKRTKNLFNLLYLSTLMTAATMPIAGCDMVSEEDIQKANTEETAVVYVFDNLEACRENGVFPADECEKAFVEAKQKYYETAPRYESQEECEREHGASEINPWAPRVDEEQKEEKDKNQPRSNHSGGGSFIYFHGGTYYSPPYSGIAAVKPSPGSSAGAKYIPVFRTQGGNLSTTNGITNLQAGQVMTIQRAAISQPHATTIFKANAQPLTLIRTSAGIRAVPAASRPTASFSARGGLGGFGSGLSAGG